MAGKQKRVVMRVISTCCSQAIYKRFSSAGVYDLFFFFLFVSFFAGRASLAKLTRSGNSALSRGRRRSKNWQSVNRRRRWKSALRSGCWSRRVTVAATAGEGQADEVFTGAPCYPSMSCGRRRSLDLPRHRECVRPRRIRFPVGEKFSCKGKRCGFSPLRPLIAEGLPSLAPRS